MQAETRGNPAATFSEDADILFLPCQLFFFFRGVYLGVVSEIYIRAPRFVQSRRNKRGEASMTVRLPWRRAERAKMMTKCTTQGPQYSETTQRPLLSTHFYISNR